MTISIPSGLSNATVAVRNALERIPNNEPASLIFEPGIHNFYLDGCSKYAPKLSNNNNDERNVAIPIVDRNGLSIEGKGATLLFHGLITPIFIKGSSSITIKDITINFAIPLYIDAVVESFDEKHLSLAIDRNEYDYKIEGSPAAITFDTAEGKICSRDIYLNFIRIDERKNKTPDWGVLNAFVFLGDCTNNPAKLPAGRMFADVEATPTGIKMIYRPECPYRPFKVGEHIFIRDPESSGSPNVIMANSAGVIFKDVTMLAGPGMGFLGQMCSDITFDHVNIRPAEGKNISTNADAIHLIQCNGKVIVRDCNISHALDDALNVHGDYFRVEKVLSSDKLLVRAAAAHHSGFVPYSVGDELIINTPQPLKEKGRAVITAVETNDDETDIVLSFDRDISSFADEGDYTENHNHLPELLFERNKIDDIPEIRVATTKKVVIRDNIFNLCCTDLHFNDLPGFWWESSPSRDVEVTNNIFMRPGPNIRFDLARDCVPERCHKKALVKGNHFADPDNAIIADKLDELIFENL